MLLFVSSFFVAPFAIPSSFAWSFHIASLVIASLFVPSLVILTSGNPVKEGRVAVRNHDERKHEVEQE